jgi:hypothetical protein
MPRPKSAGAALKGAHKSLALANPLADVVANPKLKAAVGAVKKAQADKARQQTKNRKAEAKRAARSE